MSDQGQRNRVERRKEVMSSGVGKSALGALAGRVFKEKDGKTHFKERSQRRGDKETDREKGKARTITPVILAKPRTSNQGQELDKQRDEEYPTLQQAHQSKSPPSRTPPPPPPPVAGTPASVLSETDGSSKRAESPIGSIASSLGKVLLGRKDSGGSATSVPAPANDPPLAKVEESVPSFREKGVRLIDDQQQFCGSALASSLTDSSEFLVVGVLGLQNAGKSTVLNALANYLRPKKATGAEGKESELKAEEQQFEEVRIFREQTFEKQMMGEHCTNGVKAWTSPTTRTIFLDSQPLNSASILDRSMQLVDKKHNAEFSTMEVTVEVQSMQIAAFLMSVCHVILLVQDSFIDPDLVEFVLMSEMVKPSSPAIIGSGTGDGSDAGSANQMVEYFPELVIVHNKAKLDSFAPGNLLKAREFYKRIFAKSQLKFNTGKVCMDAPDDSSNSNLAKWTKWKMGEANLFVLPEIENEDEKEDCQFKPDISFKDYSSRLRRKVLSIQPSHLTAAKLTEKTWLAFAQKTWDNIKACPFYLEYSRLLLN